MLVLISQRNGSGISGPNVRRLLRFSMTLMHHHLGALSQQVALETAPMEHWSAMICWQQFVNQKCQRTSILLRLQSPAECRVSLCANLQDSSTLEPVSVTAARTGSIDQMALTASRTGSVDQMTLLPSRTESVKE